MNAETRQELFEYLSGELGVLALESNLDDIENIINPKVYPYYLTDDSEENILPNIKKSTENLPKIEDKDKRLSEVRRNESDHIPDIGKMIEKIELAVQFGKLLGKHDRVISEVPNVELAYTHAKECVQISQQYTNNKLEELENWIKDNITVHDAIDTGVVDILGLKSKINSLK